VCILGKTQRLVLHKQLRVIRWGVEEWEIRKLEIGNEEMRMCMCISLCAGQL